MLGYRAEEVLDSDPLRFHVPEERVVFFTTNGHHAYATRAFRIGASAYVLKAAAGEDLRPALQAALDGDSFVSPSIEYQQPIL